MYKQLCLLTGVLLLAGCAQNRLDREMASWQGQHIDVVAEAWGGPDATTDGTAGRVYAWTQDRRIPLDSPEADASRYIVQVDCTRMFEVNALGIVTGWRWRGDQCWPPVWPIATFPGSNQTVERLAGIGY